MRQIRGSSSIGVGIRCIPARTSRSMSVVSWCRCRLFPTDEIIMLPEKYQWIVREFEPEGDPWLLLAIGQELERAGNLPGAATVYDRAYGLDPTFAEVRERRANVLDQLAVV